MLFLVGLECLKSEEKALLLAMLNSITPAAIANQGAQQAASTAKTAVLNGARWIVGKVSADAASAIRDFNQSTDWDTATLAANIDAEMKRVAALPPDLLTSGIRRHIIRLAETPDDVADVQLCQAFLRRLAKSVELEADSHPNVASLEDAVCSECLKRMLEELKKTLDSFSSDQERSGVAI